MAKRGNREGSIYKRGDGRFEGKVLIGYQDGRPKYKYVTRATYKEAHAAWEELKRQHAAGTNITPERQTLAQFLDRWLTDVVAPTRRATTLDMYRTSVRRITRHIGHLQLSKVTPQHVQGALNALLDDELAPATVDRARDVLRNALNTAIMWGLCSKNAASLTTKPKVDEYEPVIFSSAEAQQFIAAAQGDRLEALWQLEAYLGLRRGEVLGLRWRDVDVDKQQLHIRVNLQLVGGKLTLVKPKTKQSLRDLPLPLPLIPILHAHRARQLETKLLAGSLWTDHGLVFCTSHGTPIAPRNLLREFKALLQRAGLPDMRFHDLRHSALSLLAAQGVHPRVAQAIAGHADVRTTLNIYTHITAEQKEQAIDLLQTMFGQPAKERRS